MSTTVTLGFVTLETFEIPTAITYGGIQRMAVHDLPGGGRVTDVMGGADEDIVFGGIISGDNANTRAQLLDALRISGAPVPLSWGENYYIVIIGEAVFDYRKSWWIPYRLRCVVQSNLVYGAFATAASVAVSIAADLTGATDLLPSLSPNLAAAQSAVLQPGATTYGTAAYDQSLSTLTATQSALSTGISGAGSSLPDLDLSFAGQDPTAAAGALTGATASAGTLSSLSTAQGFIGRSLSTLLNLGT